MKSPEIPTNLEIVRPSEKVSQPPCIDLGKAKNSHVVASRFVRSYVEKHALKTNAPEASYGYHPPKETEPFESSALTLALALAIYNQEQSPQKFVREEQVTNQFQNLIREEYEASRKDSSLPTIGWEVEAPLQPYFIQTQDKTYTSRLREFNKRIGIPSNRINDAPANDDFYWEYATPPAYSADVAARILSELIKGRFIPSLKGTDDPEMIYDYLTQSQISLHINIGIPQTKNNTGSLSYIDKNKCRYLASFMALGFSSPLRMEWKKSTLLADIKDADFTDKSGTYRLEMKGLEMRNAKSYRQFQYAQLLSAALFEFYTDPDSELAVHWVSFMNDATSLMTFDETIFTKQTDDTQKQNVLKLLEDQQQEHAYELIATYAKRVKNTLDKKKKEPTLPFQGTVLLYSSASE